MRIGFDASALQRPPSRGIVRLVANLAHALERRGRVELVRLSPEPGEALRAWRQRRVPQLVRSLGLAGVHSPLSAFPLSGPGWRVQTVHELPWRHGVRENADLRHILWASMGPLRAQRVLVGCEHVARDLRLQAWGGASKIRVTPWGVGAPFSDLPPPGCVDELVLARHRFGQDPLVLCLDAVRPKKNLEAVLAGAARALGDGVRMHLVITGEHTPQLRRDLGLVSRLGIARHVSTPGLLPEEDLAPLLRLATVVPVLSKSEGFAFPVLEAMACGTAVLVPPRSAQAELAGEAGIVVEPSDAVAVAAGLARALSEREALRARLVARAAQFSWERCAESVEAVWQELA